MIFKNSKHNDNADALSRIEVHVVKIPDHLVVENVDFGQW